MAPQFGNVPNPLALPIVKHEAKFIINQTYVDHKPYDLEGYYALLLNSERVLTPTSRHHVPPIFEE